jgi:hypothetical protein
LLGKAAVEEAYRQAGEPGPEREAYSPADRLANAARYQVAAALRTASPGREEGEGSPSHLATHLQVVAEHLAGAAQLHETGWAEEHGGRATAARERVLVWQYRFLSACLAVAEGSIA